MTASIEIQTDTTSSTTASIEIQTDLTSSTASIAVQTVMTNVLTDEKMKFQIQTSFEKGCEFGHRKMQEYVSKVSSGLLALQAGVSHLSDQHAKMEKKVKG